MKLKKLLSEISVERMKVYSNPYATAFKPIKEEETIQEQDHEVSMAQNSLDTIIKNATELKQKIGEMEKDIPGWIQDHIVNSENYIEQANSGYHELGESVNEGKKRFKRQDGIGKAKYTVSFHDGKKKHKDGSDFFDIKIFKNKKDLSDFVGTLVKQGYVHESLNEADVKKKVNRRGDVDGLLVKHNGEEYEIVYSGDFDMGGAVEPYGIVMPGDDVVSFLGKDKKAKSIWKQLKPKVDKFLKSNESVNEAVDVETYHKSYTHAIEAAEVYARKKGYEIEDDEMFTKVGMNSKRPSVGKTTKVSLELLKNGKPQKKMLHIQVYGMKNGYELNAYIN